jgi:putative metal-binding protein
MSLRPSLVSLALLIGACGPSSLRNGVDAGPNAGGGPKGDDPDQQAEPCNGIDDDGDGFVDADSEGNPLQGTCETDCGSGNQYCEDGQWVCYAPQPRTEVCDNFDNDCNGQVDEGCACRVGDTQACGGQEVGACHAGTETCQSDGKWGPCSGEVPPGDEVCGNGIDDDCDGETDETCGCTPGATQACGSEAGECAPGTQRCSAEGEWSDCAGGQVAVAEICNGLDDDCDGETDESWSEDDYEQNGSCDHAYSVGSVVQYGDPMVLSQLSLFAPGDEDWFSLRALEDSDFCAFDSECPELTVRVTPETAVDPDDLEVCLIDGACTNTADPSHVFCSHGANWDAGSGSYALSVCWDGDCGFDDSRDWRVVVRSTSGNQACGNYGVAWTFGNVDGACPAGNDPQECR